MTTLHERLETDYKNSLKAKQQLHVDTIRLIKAAMQRVAIEKRKTTLDDQDVIQVLGQQANQRRETIEAAKQGNRQDALSQGTQELAVINEYLPQPLAPEALKQLIEDAIKTVGLDQGQIMKCVMGKAAGAADGKFASQLVGERLKQGQAA